MIPILDCSINPLAISPYLPIGSSQWTNISHVDHGLPKAIKEVTLAVSKPVNDGYGVRPASRKQILVALKKPAVVLEVGEVVVVEAVGGGGVEVVQGVPARVFRARLAKRFQIGWVQAWVRVSADVVEVVKASGEREALSPADCMSTWGSKFVLFQTRETATLEVII